MLQVFQHFAAVAAENCRLLLIVNRESGGTAENQDGDCTKLATN